MKKLVPLAVALFMAQAAPPTALSECPCKNAGPPWPYPTYDTMMSQVEAFAQVYSDRVALIEYGRSVEGRPLYVLKISRPGRTGMPAGFIGGNIHGNEWIGNRMAMAMAQFLVEEDGRDQLVTQAMDAMDFFVAPCINPDGYYRTSQAPCEDDNRPCRLNARGVDLNRNWPIPGWPVLPIDQAGSDDPDSIHYRGPEALSEPETKFLDRFFADHPEITAAISWHSYASVVFPAHCPSRQCTIRYKKACKAYRDNQPHIKYPRVQSRVFDSYTGEMEDWLYAEYGVLAVDIEIGRKDMNKKACDCDHLFYVFNPKNPRFWIENDSKAGISYLVEANSILGGKRTPKNER